jgi:phosphoenolpyruvate synthase/pyruvate phosphate dikinase
MNKVIYNLIEAADQPITEVGRYPSEISGYFEYGLKIPEAIIIPSSTIWKHFSDCKLADIWSSKIETLDVSTIDSSTLESLSAPIVSQIMNSDISVELRTELSKKYSNISGFSDSYVNIRLISETKNVDNAKILKKANIKGFNHLIQSLKEVIASIFQPDLLFDFYNYQISPFTLDLPIIIQKSVQPEVSGIAYNVSPIDHDPNKIQIEAIIGGLEPLVNHEIVPDNYVLSKNTLELQDRYISTQEWMQIRGAGKNSNAYNMKVNVSKIWQTKAKLDDIHLIELGNIIRNISIVNPMASIQLLWGLENNIFWLFDVKDLLKVESNFDQKYISVAQVDNFEEENNIQEIEIIKPKSVDYFESTFHELQSNSNDFPIVQDQIIESTYEDNFNYSQPEPDLETPKKPSRKGIVIVNNKIVDAGESNIGFEQGIQISDEMLRDKAKKILYGGTNSSAFNVESPNQKVVDEYSIQDEIELAKLTAELDVLKSQKNIDSEISDSIESELEITENISQSSTSKADDFTVTNDFNASQVIKSQVTLPKGLLLHIPLSQARKSQLIRKEEILNRQREAYKILYKEKLQVLEKETSPIVEEIKEEKEIVAVEKIETKLEFSPTNHETTKIEKFSASKTITKIFGCIDTEVEIAELDVLESEGLLLMLEDGNSEKFDSSFIASISEKFTPKPVFVKIPTHPDIKYNKTNVSSIDFDLKKIKFARTNSLKNIHILIPNVKTADEFEIFREYLFDFGLKQSNILKLYVSVDNIFVTNNLDKILDLGVDGVFFNVEEIIRISLGLTKEQYLLQKDLILTEYKIADTGISNLLEKIALSCKKSRIPLYANLLNFSGDNFDELINASIINSVSGIVTNIENIEKARTITKYYEEKRITKKNK